MDLRLFHVDAFTGKRFSGNPAAVCPLEEWPEDGLLHSIAAENNLSETAFFAREGDGYRLRWMTPTTEVDLCGHATLATAFVLWNHLGCSDETLRFETRSGPLTVRRRDDLIAMSFPLVPSAPAQAPPALLEALGRATIETRYAGES
ncbi:MAG: PhzF family phenazine biosynthesis protein [Acidobacteria bacterium]|nr:PhzF family phenazine biosynthesis protein [Acidobacteriota bacterium]